jgi:anti-anti-sigma regulatory factor
VKFQIDHADGGVPVTILRVEGDLDANSYEALIAEGRARYDAGARDLLVDLREVSYMGSSGLVALHTLAVVMDGLEPPDPESGWEAHHAIERSAAVGMQQHLKILAADSASASVPRVLARTGLDRFIEVHTDEAAAVAAF